MTPHAFLAKWRHVDLKERSASQSHFNDICALLGVEDPITADGKGEWFAFEKGASKTSGGEGWADVWRRGCFAWEYKGRKANLDKAFAQLQQYAIALENPPLLIVSDMETIRLHTNWTNTVQDVHSIAFEDLADAGKRDLLRNAFLNPEALRPARTRQMLTEQVAEEFATLAHRLRERGHNAETVAHFVNRLVFCLFAEDVGLLPNHMFKRMLEAGLSNPPELQMLAGSLFAAMQGGGMIGFERVDWFNGGLFDTAEALPLEKTDIASLLKAARLDWSEIDPSILGTLFERGLDPDKRSQLGAHYTDRDKIMMIVAPVIVEPLMAEWAEARARITSLLESAPRASAEKLLRGKELAAATKARSDSAAIRDQFLDRLANFRILDPACGSGNFLYLSLLALKDIEHLVNIEAEALGLPRAFPRVGPECVLGIELNPYAAELARVSVWIGEIQWMRRNGFEAARNPILKPLSTIENRDAVLDLDGKETNWPPAEAIIGNPPYAGAKQMNAKLGKVETQRLRHAFDGRLNGNVDFVAYWFEKARAAIEMGTCKRVGFVSTNSIAKNTNLSVLRRVAEKARIFNAWPDEKWVIDGAAVRVAIVCFSARDIQNDKCLLNGVLVDAINADLTTGLDVSRAVRLGQNAGLAYVGIQKSGPFDVHGELARKWLVEPANPNLRYNSEVLKPALNGNDVTKSRRRIWFIDFPRGLTESEVSLWVSPYQYLAVAPYDPDEPHSQSLRSARSTVRDEHPRNEWWTPYWPRPELRQAISNLQRYIITPMTSEHRVFLWTEAPILPDNNLVVIARDDDAHFGIVHSSIHEAWSTRLGNRMGAGNQRRYNREVVYDTFPFPEGLTPDIPAADYAADPRAVAIADAARRLNELRENWLNPADLVRREPEVVPGYPDRILPVSEAAAKELAKRTLTNLYNARPAWLDHAHKALDEAVAEAYGWGDDWRAGNLTDDEILARLFRLNQQRAGYPPTP